MNMATENEPRAAEGCAQASCSPRFPRSLLVQMWRCMIQRPRKWRLASAATKLACHGWNTGDMELWASMKALQDRLWKEVYVEENAPDQRPGAKT